LSSSFDKLKLSDIKLHHYPPSVSIDSLLDVVVETAPKNRYETPKNFDRGELRMKKHLPLAALLVLAFATFCFAQPQATASLRRRLPPNQSRK
jgi:hypothetical protein